MNQAIKESCEKPQDAEKGRIEVRPAVSFVSDATYNDSVKDKAKFIKVMCRYNTASKDVKANNYQIHVKKFDHGTPEDVLLWYGKVQEVIKQKPCEDAQAKFTMTELLLEGQGLRTFLQLKTAVTEKILVGDAQVPMGVTEESYAMTVSKFKATAFKKYAARYQVSYLRKSLRKPSNVTIRACSTRLEEINGMLKHFPGPENKALSEGDLIEILVNMAPAQWRKSMVQINFEPMQKTLTEVVEYLERLEVLDATEKKKEPQKKGNDKSENKTKSKSKGHKSSRKGKKSNKKRKRSTDSEVSSDSDNDSRSKKFCQICKAVGGTYWNHNTTDCGRIKHLKKSSGTKVYKSPRNYDSHKEINALIQEHITKALKDSKKDSKGSKKSQKDRSESSSDSEGSDSGEE